MYDVNGFTLGAGDVVKLPCGRVGSLLDVSPQVARVAAYGEIFSTVPGQLVKISSAPASFPRRAA